MSSKIPLVRSTVTEALQERNDLAGVQVTYGHPGKETDEEFIFIAGTADWDRDWAALGATQPRTDAFSLAMYLISAKPGRTQQEAVERVFDFLDIVQEVIADLGSLDGVLLLPLELKVERQEDRIGSHGREAFIEASVRVKARL